MSAKQVQNFRLLKKLLLQLKSYGLNPNDWRIERTTWNYDGNFSIHHRSDDQFRFQAEWVRSNREFGHLVTLKLASI